jgi:hypothetical protein
MMSENSRKIFEFLKANHGTQLTSADVAEALNLPKRTVDGAFTSAIQRKGLGYRIPAEVELDNGMHKPIKLLTLSDTGLAFDPDAEEVPAENA